MARFNDRKVAELLANEGIVRNRLKIASAIGNAKAFLTVQDEFGSFSKFIWQFTGGNTIQNAWSTMKEVPARTAESDRMSKELQARGFKFVGSTICYAFMQAVGMVNDHLTCCDRWKPLK
jgi:DNA-3-methyladenine glycosylase I